MGFNSAMFYSWFVMLGSQLANCSLCKHEHPSLNPQNPDETLGKVACVINSAGRSGSMETDRSMVLWSHSASPISELLVSKGTHLKEQGLSDLVRHLAFISGLQMCTCNTRMYTHTVLSSTTWILWV